MTIMSFLITKRNGENQEFDANRIFVAINKAFMSENINNTEKVMELTKSVVDKIENSSNMVNGKINVETVQDIVEQTLMEDDLHKIARNYIL